MVIRSRTIHSGLATEMIFDAGEQRVPSVVAGILIAVGYTAKVARSGPCCETAGARREDCGDMFEAWRPGIVVCAPRFQSLP
jgi:hypothetical protein